MMLPESLYINDNDNAGWWHYRIMKLMMLQTNYIYWVGNLAKSVKEKKKKMAKAQTIMQAKSKQSLKPQEQQLEP